MTTHCIRWLLAVVLLVPTPLLAQETVAYQQAWSCKFADRNFVDYRGPYRARDTLQVYIDNVDIDERSARVISNLGPQQIGLVAGDGFVTFFTLRSDSGNGQAVYILDPQMPDGRFEAVLSHKTQLLRRGPSRHTNDWGFCVGVGISR